MMNDVTPRLNSILIYDSIFNRKPNNKLGNKLLIPITHMLRDR